MWILYAFGSAFFAGATSILAKVGVKDVDSHVATAIRTIVVLIFSWIMVFIVGSQGSIGEISEKTFIFLILSLNAFIAASCSGVILVMFLSIIPILIVYPFLQRFFIKGIVVGSVKE